MHPKQNHQTHDCLLITSKQIIHMALDFFKCHMAKKMQNNIKRCLTNGIIHCILMKCSREPIDVGSQLSWESICLTSRGSQVRALQAPLIFRYGAQKQKYGGIAQLARAHGSYPWCREFKSPFRYYTAWTVCPGFFVSYYTQILHNLFISLIADFTHNP